MLKKLMLAATVAAALSACAQQIAERHYSRCRGFGFTPGTDAFSNCLMLQDAQFRQPLNLPPSEPIQAPTRVCYFSGC